MVCAVQTLLLILIFAVSISGKVYPTKGIIFPSSWIDVYITVFLVTFAADTTALVVSSIVKSSSTANTFIPIILIVQIVFCGVLFDLGDTMNNVAGIMISKWGIGALSAIYRLNECQVSLILENPELSLQMGEQMTSIDDLYVATASNLASIWLILIAFIVVTAVASRFILTRVKKDKR